MDTDVTRMLCIFIESLLPPTTIELDTSQNLQIAALLSIGLLYQKTAHRHIAEALLSEIGRPPGPEMDNSVDRESYSLAASLGLGLVVLGKGSDVVGLSDLSIADMLHYYMIGGHKKPLTGKFFFNFLLIVQRYQYSCIYILINFTMYIIYKLI